jgi:hypothetical protein
MAIFGVAEVSRRRVIVERLGLLVLSLGLTPRVEANRSKPEVVVPRGEVKAPLTECAEKMLAPTVFRILTSDFPAGPTGGPRGDGLGGGVLVFDASGSRKESVGSMAFRKSELIQVSRLSQARSDAELSGIKGPIAVFLSSVLKHNITRGIGSFEHQSPERLDSTLIVPSSLDCEKFGQTWKGMFQPVSESELSEWLKKNPAGVDTVFVEEIREGMTPSEVEAILGTPERKATMSGKTIYFYTKLKVTFRNGKVTDVE